MADSDPLANQNAVYHDRYRQMTDQFAAFLTQEDADEFLVVLDAALADPYLPRMFRAEYSVMRALYSDVDKAAPYIEAAEAALASIVEVYRVEGRREEGIDEKLVHINQAVQAVKEGLGSEERGDPLRTRAGFAEAAAEDTVEQGLEPAGAGREDKQQQQPEQQPQGIKRRRTREVSPITLMPTPPDTGHRIRKQPARRAKLLQEKPL